MKKILILILLSFLSSCSLKIIDNEKSSEIKEEKNVKSLKQENIKKINWNENIVFSFCDGKNNYKENNLIGFRQNDDVKLLEEKIDKLPEDEKYGYYKRFPRFIEEYCKTSDGKKYIFSARDKIPTKIGIYDKDLDILEEIPLKSFVFKNLDNFWYFSNRNYGNTNLEKYFLDYRKSKEKLNGFGKKHGNIISYSNYGVSLIGNTAYIPGYFSDKYQYFSQKTRDYCNSGLTTSGKLSVCFADVFYNIDINSKKIFEKRICSYYIDDNGNIGKLEKCFDINYNKNGYKLKTKAKGIDFYQDETGDLSILDIDLNSAKINFGGVDINKENSEEFNRFYAFNFPKTINNDFYSTNNIFALVNGQFFTNTKDKKTGLSFPLKSDGKIINSYIDNEIPKRTFIIDKNGDGKILEGYKNEYLENNNYNELIVGFNPEVNARKDSKIGRTYIGVKDSQNVVFFIAKEKNQEEMNKIISDYGIKPENIIMMDGLPSSQFAFFENGGPGSEWEQFYGKWKVPHFFMIYDD